MVEAARLSIALRSRYRATPGLVDRSGTVYFGLWQPPEITERRSPTVHLVAPDEVGRPDLVSFRVYRDPHLFWAIALRNGVQMPLTEIRVGVRYICPHIDDVTAGLTSTITPLE
jgi:hypothetical protein